MKHQHSEQYEAVLEGRDIGLALNRLVAMEARHWFMDHVDGACLL